MGFPWYESYERTQPREAKGGIKAQSRRGGFGQSWWTRRWIEVLEGFDIGARLSRGRSYARRGQVLSIDIDRGRVAARVQGSRAQPYHVNIDVKELTRTDWETLARALSARAIFAASLLAGQMPENIEEVFRDADLSLFPTDSGDLETDCSCPDWSNPCKHIAAVYYLLGEEFDRDPFLVFRLRGVEREELMGLVGSQSAGRGESDRADTANDSSAEEESRPLPPEPPGTDPEEFWGQISVEDDSGGEASVPQVSAALPRRLGNFPFWRGKEGFLPALEEVYRNASPAGLDAFLGERPRAQ